jgi:hypothetical protein
MFAFSRKKKLHKANSDKERRKSVRLKRCDLESWKTMTSGSVEEYEESL